MINWITYMLTGINGEEAMSLNEFVTYFPTYIQVRDTVHLVAVLSAIALASICIIAIIKRRKSA